MKRTSITAWLAGVFGVFVGVAATAADNPWEPKLPFKSAVIHYDVSGSQTGAETLYLRDSGRESVKITKSEGKVMFVKTATNAIEITNPESIIRIDMNEKTGSRVTNPQKFIQEEIGKLSDKERAIVIRNLEALGTNMATQMGGQIEKKAGEHLGYACDIVSVMGTTSCQMSGTPILLKMATALPGMKMETVATRIEKNARVPDDLFQVPPGINVEYNEQADNMSREMVHNMITAMKDPQAADKMAQGMAQGVAAGKAAAPARQAARQDAGEAEDMPSEEEINKMMGEGMKALKGLMGK